MKTAFALSFLSFLMFNENFHNDILQANTKKKLGSLVKNKIVWNALIKNKFIISPR